MEAITHKLNRRVVTNLSSYHHPYLDVVLLSPPVAGLPVIWGGSSYSQSSNFPLATKYNVRTEPKFSYLKMISDDLN